jgi:hypothetical protein
MEGNHRLIFSHLLIKEGTSFRYYGDEVIFITFGYWEGFRVDLNSNRVPLNIIG